MRWQQIKKAAKGPVWAAIDFVGNAQTAQLGVDSLVKGGKLIVVGLFGGDITLSLPFLPIRAMTIQGSYTGSLQGARRADQAGAQAAAAAGADQDHRAR